MRVGVGHLVLGSQPANSPTPSTDFGIAPPTPAPFHGDTQRVWLTALYPASQAAALAPAVAPWPEIWGCGKPSTVAAAVAASDSSSGGGDGVLPNVAACSMNGHCGSDRYLEGGKSLICAYYTVLFLSDFPPSLWCPRCCVCGDAWRGPSCAALKLGPTPRNSGTRHHATSRSIHEPLLLPSVLARPRSSIIRMDSSVYLPDHISTEDGCGLLLLRLPAREPLQLGRQHRPRIWRELAHVLFLHPR